MRYLQSVNKLIVLLIIRICGFYFIIYILLSNQFIKKYVYRIYLHNIFIIIHNYIDDNYKVYCLSSSRMEIPCYIYPNNFNHWNRLFIRNEINFFVTVYCSFLLKSYYNLLELWPNPRKLSEVIRRQ